MVIIEKTENTTQRLTHPLTTLLILTAVAVHDTYQEDGQLYLHQYYSVELCWSHKRNY